MEGPAHVRSIVVSRDANEDEEYCGGIRAKGFHTFLLILKGSGEQEAATARSYASFFFFLFYFAKSL